jgi:hypothetical protein
MADSQHTNEKLARTVVSQRLRQFYSALKADLEADSEDFYRRVMQQAERLHPDAPAAHPARH